MEPTLPGSSKMHVNKIKDDEKNNGAIYKQFNPINSLTPRLHTKTSIIKENNKIVLDINLNSRLKFYKSPPIKSRPPWKANQSKFSTKEDIDESSIEEKALSAKNNNIKTMELITKLSVADGRHNPNGFSDHTMRLRELNISAFLSRLQVIVGDVNFQFGENQFFMKPDGSVLFLSNNPVIATLFSYFSLNQLNNKRKSSRSILLESGSLVLPTVHYKQEDLNQHWFIDQCVDSYFENYSYFCPVIDEVKFRSGAPDLVRKIVIAFGYKHIYTIEPSQELLQLMDNDIISEYKSRMYQPTLDHISVLILMFQYQVCPSEAGSISLYLSRANNLCYLLGLHLPFPKSKKISDEHLRYRYNQWWGCTINDRLYSLILNKPFTFEHIASELPYPMPPIPKDLAKFSNYADCVKVRNCAGAIYWKGKTIYSDLMVYYVNYKQIDRKATASVNLQLAVKILTRIDNFNTSHVLNMSKIWINQPLYVKKICVSFLNYHYVFYHSYVLEVIKIYMNNPLTTDIATFKYRYFSSATLCISAAEDLGHMYYRQGVMYRFSCVYNAIMVFAKLLCSDQEEPLLKDPEFVKAHPALIQDQYNNTKPISLMMVDRGLAILSKALPYNPIVKPFINIILDVVSYSYDPV